MRQFQMEISSLSFKDLKLSHETKSDVIIAITAPPTFLRGFQSKCFLRKIWMFTLQIEMQNESLSTVTNVSTIDSVLLRSPCYAGQITPYKGYRDLNISFWKIFKILRLFKDFWGDFKIIFTKLTKIQTFYVCISQMNQN